jgi:hypothetical protein
MVGRHGVAQPFPGGQPKLEVAAGGPAGLFPQQVGGVLDFRLGRLDAQGSHDHAPTYP